MITQEELKELLNYNPDTGIFTWKVSKAGNRGIGSIAGYNSNGYIKIGIYKKYYFAHRLVWLYVYGEMPKYFIDHVNTNKHDNRLCNLRIATNSQNQHNAKINKKNTSGVKGVSWNKQAMKWTARLKINCKSKFIGYFDSIENAKMALIHARNNLHKEFANNG